MRDVTAKWMTSGAAAMVADVSDLEARPEVLVGKREIKIVKTKSPSITICVDFPIAAGFPVKIDRSSFPLRGERLFY